MRVKLAILALGIASMLLGLSPSAKADTFKYDFTLSPSSATCCFTNIVFTITAATLPPSGDVTSFTSATSTLGTIIAFAWGAPGPCLGGAGFSFNGCAAFEFINSFPGGSDTEDVGFDFPAGSFLSPGTYTGGGSTTVVITDLGPVGIPEPSSLVLLSCGLFGLLAIASFESWNSFARQSGEHAGEP
jgi:hypothetical protein